LADEEAAAASTVFVDEGAGARLDSPDPTPGETTAGFGEGGLSSAGLVSTAVNGALVSGGVDMVISFVLLKCGAQI
jgi:hypothetical protein